MKRVEVIIDNQVLSVRQDIPLIQALREQGILLPSLCYHHLLGGYGSCGLCVVEIYTGAGWRPRHACLLQPEAGLQVKTNTPTVLRLRARAARLLLRRGPFPKKEVEELLGHLVQKGEKKCFEPDDKEAAARSRAGNPAPGCILCGLCVRICEKIRKSRLTFLGRGKNLQVSFVSAEEETAACGSCKACQRICPTGFIEPSAREAFTARLYK